MTMPVTRPPNRRIPPESTSFFAGINNNLLLSRDLPQPVVARNSGLIDAWHPWARMQEDPADQGLTAQLMATTRRTFNQNLSTLLYCARPDPIWQLNEPKGGRRLEEDEGALVLPTAALMFWTRQHALIETTDALEELLVHSDIGDEMPCNLFRPPVPALFIRFGKAFQDVVPLPPLHGRCGPCRLQGVYVFHATREENRVVSMVPVFEEPAMGRYCANTIEIVINNEARSLNAEIHAICHADGVDEHFNAIAQIVAKVFFYMQQSQVVQVEDRSYSIAVDRMKGRSAKKAARLARHMPHLYDRIVLGPHEVLGHQHGELSTHLRRGHFRMQPYGPQSSLRKVIFVAPTWIRPDRLSACA